MKQMKTFYVSNADNKQAPGIFGYRLKQELEKHNFTFSYTKPDVNLCFSSGKYIKDALNILRVDNLYFDSKNTIGDTDKLNAPIKRAYFGFDAVIFQSEFSKLQYFKHFGAIEKPYKVIYNGVPSTFNIEGAKKIYPFDKTIICSADWRRHKRLNEIVLAFNAIKKPNVGLVVLGDCKKLGQKGNIMYLGKVRPEDLPEYIRGANLAVHISWLDCSPNVVYEFLGCGLPVICNSNGGTKEIVKENGIVLELEGAYKFNRVDLYNPPKIDINKVTKSMAFLLEKGKGAFKKREDVYIDKTCEEYLRFIEELK